PSAGPPCRPSGSTGSRRLRRRCRPRRDFNLRTVARRDTKRRISKAITVKLVNPVVRRLLERGLMPRTQALLETTGRKSGLPRRVPIGNGLRGDTFWIVTEHGNRADYVRNIRKDPRVRV